MKNSGKQSLAALRHDVCTASGLICLLGPRSASAVSKFPPVSSSHLLLPTLEGWERVESWGTRSWGILFGLAMATAAVRGTGRVLCRSVHCQDSDLISGTWAQHQTIWSPGKVQLGPPLSPPFDHIVGQEWSGEGVQSREMCAQQKHNNHRNRTGSVFLSVPQIQRSTFPNPCQHSFLKGWAPSVQMTSLTVRKEQLEGKLRKTPEFVELGKPKCLNVLPHVFLKNVIKEESENTE